MKQIITFLAIGLVAGACSHNSNNSSTAPLMEMAEHLVSSKASRDEVVSRLGPPQLEFTNSRGVVLNYVLKSEMEEKWQGLRCGGVQIVIIEDKASEMLPILTN